MSFRPRKKKKGGKKKGIMREGGKKRAPFEPTQSAPFSKPGQGGKGKIRGKKRKPVTTCCEKKGASLPRVKDKQTIMRRGVRKTQRKPHSKPPRDGLEGVRAPGKVYQERQHPLQKS